MGKRFTHSALPDTLWPPCSHDYKKLRSFSVIGARGQILASHLGVITDGLMIGGFVS